MKNMTSSKNGRGQPRGARKNPNLNPVPRTRAQLEALAAEVAGLKLEEVRLAAELDARIRLAREQLEPRLAEVRAAITAQTAAAREWAEANRAAFQGRRSLELPEAFLGWRAGQPALKPLEGCAWEDVVARLKILPAMRDYLRVREEPNKLRLLADRVALGEDGLSALGLRVVQDDSFFLEPRLEATGVNARESLAA
jgi:phage host-nuclease inhibitor protein Gam